MGFIYTPLALLVTASVVSVVLTIYGWRHRRAPGAIPFIVLMLFVAEWALAYAFELGSTSLQSKVLWASVKYFGVVTVPVAWLFFLLQYTRREQWLTRRNIALFSIVPFVTLLLVWTNDLHGLIWKSIGLDSRGLFSMRISTYGRWFWIYASYAYVLLLIGTILIVHGLIHSPHLYRRQTGSLLVAVLVPWIGNALYISGLNPVPNLDLTPFAFTITGLALTWSVFGFRLLDIVPVARESVIESMSDAVIVLDMQNRIVDLNPAAQRIIGCTASEAIGQWAEKMLSNWPDLVGRYSDATEIHSEIVSGEDKNQRYFDLRISPLCDQHDRSNGRLLMLRDITERKQAEEVLQKAHNELERRVEERTAQLLITNEKLKREIEERVSAEESLKESLMVIGRVKREWESTADSLPQLICLLDDLGYTLRTNRTVERWNIGRVVNVKGQSLHELLHPLCTDPACYLENFWKRAWKELAEGRPSECEVEDRTISRYLHIQVCPISPRIYREGEETTSYAVVIVNDITEHKRAEEEMAALQDQLRQSQKMEAIGRLTGGIAHDFNNLLTPIVGYSQLAVSALPSSDPMRADLQEIQNAADRAAKLIRQMMMFSRRQPQKSQVINLNNVLLDMDKMLRRLIGEHIELVTLPAQDLGSAKVDPGQFEQVLVNLVVNARDAMPNGGKLILETSNVTLEEDYVHQHAGRVPGKYVRVVVSDNGIGMTDEVKAHLFEPFFTTKEKGQGTGLGLATCYGIIKQSNGHIAVYSEQGQGTTFKVYLPRIDEEPGSLPRRDEVGYLPKGNERVLLVEDEPLVRNLAVRILRNQGYTVLEATNGSEAIRVAHEHARDEIHLLLTDIVMPQMGGKELADRLRLIRPGIKVLFTSGYTDNTIVQHGLLDPDIAFLEKPFSPAALVRKVREVLDR